MAVGFDEDAFLDDESLSPEMAAKYKKRYASGADRAMGAGTGALSGAATGGKLGSLLGPEGAAIGAGVGALAGGIMGAKNATPDSNMDSAPASIDALRKQKLKMPKFGDQGWRPEELGGQQSEMGDWDFLDTIGNSEMA